MKRNYGSQPLGPLISPSQLKGAINSDAPPVILDCTWFMPNAARSAAAEFKAARIPGARFFDLDDVTDKSSPYPHMLPSAEEFAGAVGILIRSKTKYREAGNNSRGSIDDNST
jgi:3-mercaptopyruvate sulfurtransferase SseA